MRKKVLLLSIATGLIIFSGCTAINQIKRQIDKFSGSPTVSSVEPKDNAKNVALDTEIKITFSGEMNQETLNAKGIVVSYVDKSLVVYVNPFLNSEYAYDPGSKTVTIKPSQKFVPDQEIEVIVNENVKNVSGKSLPSGGGADDNDRYRFTFRTAKVEGEKIEEQSKENKIEETSDTTFNESMAKNAAVDFIINKSETYKFDGREDTLEVKKVDKIGCEGCFDVIATFTSKNKGYGDRTNQGLTSGDTFHTVTLRIENGEVTEATTDEKWDELTQKEILNGQ